MHQNGYCSQFCFIQHWLKFQMAPKSWWCYISSLSYTMGKQTMGNTIAHPARPCRSEGLQAADTPKPRGQTAHLRRLRLRRLPPREQFHIVAVILFFVSIDIFCQRFNVCRSKDIKMQTFKIGELSRLFLLMWLMVSNVYRSTCMILLHFVYP